MPTSTILSDNGVSSGTTGIKTAGGDDGTLVLQTTNSLGAATTAVTISNTQVTTLANALPAGSGGTGITSVGTAGNVLTSNGTAWVSQAAAAGGGDYIMQVYAGPSTGTWTKPAGLKAVKVTVVGGGGAGGNTVGPACFGYSVSGGGGGGGTSIEYLDAPAIPGPQPYTAGAAGGTSSFGSPAFLSATGGAASTGVSSPGASTQIFGSGGAGGVGSGGQLNIIGGAGTPGGVGTDPARSTLGSGAGGAGGSSTMGGGATGVANNVNGTRTDGTAAGAYGAGGGGAVKLNSSPSPTQATGGAGSPGVVIVEEFY